MLVKIDEEVRDLEQKITEAGFDQSQQSASDTASLVSGIGGFKPIMPKGSSTTTSLIKGIGYAPSASSNEFISGSSKGLLSMSSQSKADRREDRQMEKMAAEAQAFLLNNSK